jgi:PAS domain S-box-containing protein
VNSFPENTIAENPSLNSDFEFKGIVDISPYPIFIHRGGIVKYANQLAKKMIGADANEDITGINIAHYCHPDDLNKLKEAIEEVHSTHISGIMDFRMVDRDSNVRSNSKGNYAGWYTYMTLTRSHRQKKKAKPTKTN